MRWIAFTVLLGLASLWPISKSTTFQFFGEAIDRVDTTQPIVALTFDDGPSAKHTASVIEILDAADIKATFFLTGREAAENVEAFRALVAAGHEIGNHSYHHDRLILKSQSRIKAELDRTDATFRDLGYDGPIAFRPPYGQKLFQLPLVLRAHNRPSVMWDVAPDDLGMAADAYAAEVIASAKPGSIILMHVMYDSRDVARAALPDIISGLQDKGFKFVTISALLAER